MAIIRPLSGLRGISHAWSNQFGTFAPAIIATIVVAAVFLFADGQRIKQLEAAERATAAQQLATISARIETNVNGNVKLLQGLVANIAVEPGMGQERFSALSEQLFRGGSQLRNIAAAPDLIVRWIYPEEENKLALGLDYRKNEQQRGGVLAARNTHNVVLAGPINVVQGGTGLIARCPVYTLEGTAQVFWGIVSGVIDIKRLFEDSGLLTGDMDVAASLTAQPLSAKDVFYGDMAVFSGDPVRLTLNLGYSTWQIAAVPRSGWVAQDNMGFFRISAAIVSFCIIAPLIWAGFLGRGRQKTIEMLRRREVELEKTRQTLEYQSLHDALTGLPNRRYIDQLIAQQHSRSRHNRFSFIHVDLDRFKEVNDSLGHAAGDIVLKVATARLQAVLGADEFAARIGGDEFVVVIRGASLGKRSTELAERIVEGLAVPIVIDGVECRIGGSAGVAWQTDADESLNQLLINADISLYEAKKRGRGRAEIFSKELRAAAILSKQVADDLVLALERDEFVAFFQPQFDAKTHELAGVEALARWDHPQKGILTPDKFLATAESLNRVGEIDRLILEKALFQSTRWDSLGIVVPKVSVNVSAQRLKDPTLISKLENTPFKKGLLCFELLESISFDGHDAALTDAIVKLKAIGVDIEIDDFGTGHASIISLLTLSPKRLKIDRQLIAPITTSPSQRQLVSSIIEIGRSQGIEIVAEGVETFEHARILLDLGCHILQGYAFAKPMSSEAFLDFCMARRNPSHAAHAKTGS